MNSIFYVLGALLAVLSAVMGLGYILKYYENRFSKKSWWHNEHLKVLGAIGIDSKNRLVLVECGTEKHLLLINPTTSLLVQQNVTLKETNP